MKYKKLFEDKNKGLIPDDMIIVFDNDSGFWKCENENETIAEAKEKEFTDKYGSPNGYQDIVDIMIGAGFNSEWC